MLGKESRMSNPEIQVAVSLWLKIPPWGTAHKYPDHTFYTVDVIAPPGSSAEDIADAIKRQIKAFQDSQNEQATAQSRIEAQAVC